uniref:Glycine-rich domain-containing protein n=1 Tax=viral metagenome TaxID=1070528 RepID=A0A6C0BN39_9ZZZZ
MALSKAQIGFIIIISLIVVGLGVALAVIFWPKGTDTSEALGPGESKSYEFLIDADVDQLYNVDITLNVSAGNVDLEVETVSGDLIFQRRLVAQSQTFELTLLDPEAAPYTAIVTNLNTDGTVQVLDWQLRVTAVDKEVIFTTSGTYQVPSGVTSLNISCTGAGGGGGGGGQGVFAMESDAVGGAGGGGGGAGQEVITENIPVMEGEILTIEVGEGGAGGRSETDGNDGGDSSVTGTNIDIVAVGGEGGKLAGKPRLVDITGGDGGAGQGGGGGGGGAGWLYRETGDPGQGGEPGGQAGAGYHGGAGSDDVAGGSGNSGGGGGGGGGGPNGGQGGDQGAVGREGTGAGGGGGGGGAAKWGSSNVWMDGMQGGKGGNGAVIVMIKATF